MNRLFLLLFGMVTFVAHAQVPDYLPTEGLVAWFNMNGTILNEVDGIQGLTTGTEPTTDRNGISGSALAFSGNAFGVINDVDFPTNEVTISAWIYESQSWSNGDGIEFICLGSASSTTWGTIAGPQRMKLNRGRGCSGSNQNNLMAENFQLNTWVHVAFVSQGFAMPTDVYINGEHLGQHMNYTSGSCSSNNLYFGVDIFSAPEYINGSLDDIGVWNRTLSAEEITALYNEQSPIPGCTDPTACNYDAEATWNDDTCEYGCLNCGPGTVWNDSLSLCLPSTSICGEGTIWDANLQACVGFNDCPSDLDGDGLIGVEDLLSLLSDFGTDCVASDDPETAEWTCGDPVSYQGYDYATVQIGEQCWFAENLRTAQYANGDSIPGGLSTSEWQDGDNTNLGAQAIYNNDLSILADYGRLYNSYAVNDARGVCPSGWHVPTDEEWITLEMELGMTETEANSINFRGTDEGTFLKSSPSDDPSWNGTNTSGFSGLAGGQRDHWGGFYGGGDNGYFWTSSAEGDNAWYRALYGESTAVWRNGSHRRIGFSVRCLQNAE